MWGPDGDPKLSAGFAPAPGTNRVTHVARLRDKRHPFPSHYPGANAPQAWSASGVFCLLQSMLGLHPYAPLHMLLLDPQLRGAVDGGLTLGERQVGRSVWTADSPMAGRNLQPRFRRVLADAR